MSMNESFISIDRMIQIAVNDGDIDADEIANNGKMLLSQVREMNQEEVISRIRESYQNFSLDEMKKESRKFISSEEYSEHLRKDNGIEYKEIGENFLWMGIQVLWERYCSYIPSLESVDNKLFRGYQLMESHRIKDVIMSWLDAWNEIKELMLRFNIKTIEEFQKRFRSNQSLIEWANDFLIESYNAGVFEPEFMRSRIDFAMEFLNRYKGENKLVRENMKIAVAESYFSLDRKLEGEILFAKYLEEDPQWGQGWIAWADCYWIIPKGENKNTEKAEKILTKGIAVDEVRDMWDIKERLMELYYFQDRDQDAQIIEDQLNEKEAGRRNEIDSMDYFVRKVGRNEECPCGSGKKFKKCCGI